MGVIQWYVNDENYFNLVKSIEGVEEIFEKELCKMLPSSVLGDYYEPFWIKLPL